MGRFDGKVSLITGGGRGIGRGIAQVLAREGARILIADIDLANANATAEELRATGSDVSVVECDVTSEGSATAAIAAGIDKLGGIDVLVNNAGVVGGHTGGGSITLDDWDSCYEVNLKGSWIMSRSVVPHFKERQGGKIVNIASIAGREGGAGLAHYCASKSGVISLTQSLAQELGPSNINVNAVCPGLLWTDMWRSLEGMLGNDTSPEVVENRKFFDAHLAQNCPLRREQTPEDIGEAVAFLASDAARNITGQSLNVDGGLRLN